MLESGSRRALIVEEAIAAWRRSGRERTPISPTTATAPERLAPTVAELGDIW
jgi:hypothetical protein